jgi:two-component system, chemotaxis family, sensor kinase CheA
MLDMIAAKLAVLDAPRAEPKGEAPPLAGEKLFETVRVEIEEIDTLLDSVSEGSVQLTALRREAETVERARQLAVSLVEHAAPQHKAVTNGAGRADTGTKSRAIAEELRNPSPSTSWPTFPLPY